MKLPETCAVCERAGKDIILHRRYEWNCWNTFESKHIPCKVGTLPNPPKWCPLRRKP